MDIEYLVGNIKENKEETMFEVTQKKKGFTIK